MVPRVGAYDLLEAVSALACCLLVRSLANYTAETGFAPATYDVFIEAPMSAVDRANLDLVLPQIAAQHIFVRPAEHGLG